MVKEILIFAYARNHSWLRNTFCITLEAAAAILGAVLVGGHVCLLATTVLMSRKACNHD